MDELLSLQNNDGGWGWAGIEASDPPTSAVAAEVLWRSGKLGLLLEEIRPETVGFLRAALSGLEGDLAGRARLLRALALAGEASYASLNRLLRIRERLGSGVLADLGMACRYSGRREEAKLVAGVLDRRLVKVLEGQEGQTVELEEQARAAAVVMMNQESWGQARKLASCLLDQGLGRAWGRPEATSAVIGALALAVETKRGSGGQTLSLQVNGQQLDEVQLDPAGPAAVLRVPAELVRPAGNEVSLSSRPHGSFSYSVLLTGLVEGLDRSQRDRHVLVKRRYEPAPLRIDGRELPMGVGILEDGGSPGPSTASHKFHPSFEDPADLSRAKRGTPPSEGGAGGGG